MAADPVAAFFEAHRTDRTVALPTSGTSGTTRWVLRTTASWVASFDAVTELTGLTSASRIWLPGPLTATMNLFAAVHARSVSADLVDDPARATHAVLTPAALARCLGDVPLEGVRIVVAGDRLAPSLANRAGEAGARVHHYYGAAELSFVAWGTHADDLWPFPGVHVEVRDGEVRVRSPYVCIGYVGTPGPLLVDPDGFATVGDRGVLADDGRLTLLGRPDAVTTGGATVLVADVEAALRPAAAGDLAVVGLPHDVLGSVVVAVLTSQTDLDAVRAAARSALVGPSRPRQWFHVPELPLTPAAKVDRAALVSLLSAGPDRVRRLV